jgi:hypothetical protein
MTDCALKQRIVDDMKAAMRARDAERLSVIRYLLSVIKQKEIDERISLTDPQVLAIIEKLIKQRLETIEQSEKIARADIAEKEKAELAILKTYLPEQLPEAEIDHIVEAAIAESKATSVRDMGKVMALVKPQIQGRADMGMVSAKIKSSLSA